MVTGRLAPLLVGVAVRQALSPTARLQAGIDREDCAWRNGYVAGLAKRSASVD